MERFPSLETVKSKEYFEGKLDTILNTPLSVETVNTFADKALHDLITLTREATAEYQKSHTTEKAGKELEDEAYEALGLTGVSDLLTQVEEKSTQIGAITEYLESVTDTKNIITPPDAGKPIQEGSGGFEEKKLLPRLTTLLYIIETDFNIPKEELTIVRGNVSDEMMRNEPYFRIGIDGLGKTVYVCDEEGNASYVFDSEKLSEAGVEIEALDVMTKDEKNVLIKNHPGLGVRIIQTKDWRSQMSELLSVEELKLKEPRSASLKKEFVSKLNKEELEKYPKVETEGEWKGFWADSETGKHYGSARQLGKKFGVQKFIKIWADQFSLESRVVRDLKGKPYPAYAIEDFLSQPEVGQFLKTPNVETEGDWKGFWADPETGKHYGIVKQIIHKLGNIGHDTLSDWIHKFNLTSREVRGSKGYGVAYAIEDFLSQPEVGQFLKTPNVETEGDWKGFWADPETGKHYGVINQVGARLKIGNFVVEKWADRYNFQSREVRNLNGVLYPAFAVEDFLTHPEIERHLKAPEVETEGDWKGFWADPETGKHYGVANQIALKFNTGQSTIKRWSKEFNLHSRDIRDSKGELLPSFAIEDFLSVPWVQKFLEKKSLS